MKVDAETADKLLLYIQQENEVLHAKIAKLEISLSSEREACAKVAEEFAAAEWRLAIQCGGKRQMEGGRQALMFAAELIRRRGD